MYRRTATTDTEIINILCSRLVMFIIGVISVVQVFYCSSIRSHHSPRACGV